MNELYELLGLRDYIMVMKTGNLDVMVALTPTAGKLAIVQELFTKGFVNNKEARELLGFK